MDERGGAPDPGRAAPAGPRLRAALWLWLAVALGAYLFQFRAVAARLVRLLAG